MQAIIARPLWFWTSCASHELKLSGSDAGSGQATEETETRDRDASDGSVESALMTGMPLRPRDRVTASAERCSESSTIAVGMSRKMGFLVRVRPWQSTSGRLSPESVCDGVHSLKELAGAACVEFGQIA